MKRKRKQQNPIKTILIAVVMAGLIIGYYFHLSNKTAETVAEAKVNSATETDKVLLRNIDTDYPPSPKEVVKYYAQISKCFYDGDYTDAQLKELAERSRSLFDDELKNNQTDEEYYADLLVEIARYKQNDIKISSYSTSSSVDVDYKTTKDGELASLYCLFNMRQGTTLRSSNHTFILRKDDSGHWKILGWTLAKEEES